MLIHCHPLSFIPTHHNPLTTFNMIDSNPFPCPFYPLNSYPKKTSKESQDPLPHHAILSFVFSPPCYLITSCHCSSLCDGNASSLSTKIRAFSTSSNHLSQVSIHEQFGWWGGTVPGGDVWLQKLIVFSNSLWLMDSLYAETWSLI